MKRPIQQAGADAGKDRKGTSILETIAAHARERVREAKQKISPEEMKRLAIEKAEQEKQAGIPQFRFEKALAGEDIHFICEVKKASPSKGLIAPDFPYKEIAESYEEAGASCISVLTEPKWFLGSDEYLKEIAETVSLPCIRKDFIVDEYMIYEAKVLGASAVLLIAAILDEETLKRYRETADALGLTALVEAHDEKEIEAALKAGARLLGVNNRNLHDFTVDIRNSMRLRKLVPPQVLFVAESGIRTAEDIRQMRLGGVNAVLVGETLMRAPDKKQMLEELQGGNLPAVKICGLTCREDALRVNEAKPEYAGFVFAEGRRRTIAPEKAAELAEILDPEIRTVGVFVNQDPAFIVDLVNRGLLDAVQLHGQETPEEIERIRKQARFRKEQGLIIKAFRIEKPEDIEEANCSGADLVLLDNGAGGTGKTFDHSLLSKIRRPYILAGGLSPENVTDILKNQDPFERRLLYGLDVSSGVETGGVKDSGKIRDFVQAVRRKG